MHQFEERTIGEHIAPHLCMLVFEDSLSTIGREIFFAEPEELARVMIGRQHRVSDREVISCRTQTVGAAPIEENGLPGDAELVSERQRFAIEVPILIGEAAAEARIAELQLVEQRAMRENPRN